MPTLQTCPKTGNYIYRKSIPAALRHLIGRGSEWKVSFGTKSLTEARPLFAAESARCEAAIALARSSLKGESRLQPSDAPKLADRWAAAELTAWERDSGRIYQFLAQSGDAVVMPLELQDKSEPWGDPKLQRLLAAAIQETLTSAGHAVPAVSSLAYTVLRQEFFINWHSLSWTALQRHRGDWRSTPDLPAASLPLSQESATQGRTGKGLLLSEVVAKWAESKKQDSAGLGDQSKTIAEYTDWEKALICTANCIRTEHPIAWQPNSSCIRSEQ